MAANMEASMFSMISMFSMHVRVCMHACMRHPLHTHANPHPHPPIRHPPEGGGPPESLKIR